MCECMHVCRHMNARVSVSVCVTSRNNRKEGNVGLLEGENQRTEVFASQEKMEFKEKIFALGDSESHLHSVNLSESH